MPKIELSELQKGFLVDAVDKVSSTQRAFQLAVEMERHCQKELWERIYKLFTECQGKKSTLSHPQDGPWTITFFGDAPAAGQKEKKHAPNTR